MSRRNFQPSTRGSLVEIADRPSKIDTIKPESPRPAEFLRGIRVDDGIKLTALDLAVWEMVLSWTYEVDPKMEGRSYRIPTAALRRFVGEFTKRSEVVASFNRLMDIRLSFGDQKTRLYCGVQMLLAWEEATPAEQFLAYQFAEPVRVLMRDMTEYAHIELAALCSMSSKYDAALYKWLALEASRYRWMPGDAEVNTFHVSVTPDMMATILDYPRADDGTFNIGKLTALVLAHKNRYDEVRRFKAKALNPRYESVRGRKISSYDFEIVIQPPSPYDVAARYSAGEKRMGGMDDKRYQVRSDLWLRAHKAFGQEDAFAGYMHWNFFDLWLVALSEALNRKTITQGYDTRSCRGASLLAMIEHDGPEKAAWSLVLEEMQNPDLTHYLRTHRSYGTQIARLAQYDRWERIGWSVKKKREHALKWAAKATAASSAETISESFVTGGKEADDLSYADAFKSASFDTCQQIEITIKEMKLEAFESTVVSILKSGSGEGRKVVVALGYEDTVARSSGVFERELTLTFEEWCQLLVELQPHMIGTEWYL